MSETTPRLALPMIVPGQAQKEMTHNEALALLDAAVQAHVIELGRDTPPAAPTPGDCWIVGTAPIGAWHAHPQDLAMWTDGGWRFVSPTPGFRAWVDVVGGEARYVAGAWELTQPSPAIAEPAGGATVDDHARTAIDAILTVLRQQRLIKTN